MITISRLGPDEFEITGHGKRVVIDKERYEDIYYCIPETAGEYKNETEFFRQLTDNIAQNQDERDIFNFMLSQEADSRGVLRDLQDQARALEP